MTAAQLRRRTIVRGAFWTLVAALFVALFAVDWYACWPLAMCVIVVLWLVVIALFVTERWHE